MESEKVNEFFENLTNKAKVIDFSFTFPTEYIPSFHDFVHIYIWPVTFFFASTASIIFFILALIRNFSDFRLEKLLITKKNIEKKVLIHLQNPFDNLKALVLEHEKDIPILAEVVTGLLRNLKGRSHDELLSSMKKVGLYDWGLKQLDSIWISDKITAINLMKNWPDYTVKEKFRKLLNHRNNLVSLAAIFGLSASRDSEYLYDLIQQFRKRNDISTPLMSDLIQKFGDNCINELLSIANNAELGYNIRLASLNALFNLEVIQETIPTAMRLIEIKHSGLRAVAYKFLALSDQKIPLNILEKGIKDKSWLVKKYIADCLAKVEPMPVAMLTTLLSDKNWLVSLSSGKAFYSFGEKGRKVLQIIAEGETSTSIRAKMILDEYS